MEDSIELYLGILGIPHFSLYQIYSEIIIVLRLCGTEHQGSHWYSTPCAEVACVLADDQSGHELSLSRLAFKSSFSYIFPSVPIENATEKLLTQFLLYSTINFLCTVPRLISLENDEADRCCWYHGQPGSPTCLLK